MSSAQISSASPFTRDHRTLFIALMILAGLWGSKHYLTHQNTYYIGTQAFAEDSVRSCTK